MVDVVDTSPTGRQVGQLLGTSLVQTPDGVELAYRVLEHIAALHQLERAWLVLHPAVLGPQVFVRGRQPAPPALLADLLTRPPGLYTDPDAADLDVRRALAGTCNMVLSAQAAAAVAAVDVVSGLASRAVTDEALARVAAQAARHGWPTTVVLLQVRGDDERWPAFCRALRAALRTGDEAGVAGAGQAVAILGNAETDVARPFLSRLRVMLEAAGARGIDFASAIARTPEETVDPRELWRLLRERIGTPSGTAPATAAGGVLSGPLELELRALPGVVSVGLTAGGTPATGGGTQLTVAAVDAADTLRLDVTRVLGDQLAEATVNLIPVTVPGGLPAPAGLARAFASVTTDDVPHRPAADEPAMAEPHGAPEAPVGTDGAPTSTVVADDAPHFRPESPSVEPRNGNGRHETPPAPPSRVTLLTVRFDPDTGTSQVDLAYGTARATGRATAGPLAGGAQATLAALEALGLEVPYYLVSAEQATRIVGEPVVVVLAPRVAPGERPAGLGQRRLTRIGVAEGAEPVEAASRATLGALNRFLSREKKVPAP